jgi:hypothetical protein
MHGLRGHDNWQACASPAEGLSTGYREVSRDRVLTDNELAAIIVAARKIAWPYSGIVEFLALTD